MKNNKDNLWLKEFEKNKEGHFRGAVATNTEKALFFLKKDPDLAKMDAGGGRYPLHYAACHGKTKLVEALLKIYPEAAEKVVSGKTPLILAIGNRYTETVAAILKSQPKTATIKDDRGSTPLHHAALHDAQDIAELLLKNLNSIEEINMKNNFNVTPLQTADARGYHEVKAHIEKKIKELKLRKAVSKLTEKWEEPEI